MSVLIHTYAWVAMYMCNSVFISSSAWRWRTFDELLALPLILYKTYFWYSYVYVRNSLSSSICNLCYTIGADHFDGRLLCICFLFLGTLLPLSFPYSFSHPWPPCSIIRTYSPQNTNVCNIHSFCQAWSVPLCRTRRPLVIVVYCKIA